MNNSLKPDNKQVIDFLKIFHPNGPWVLSAIQLDKKKITTETFYPKDYDKCNSWLDRHNGKDNLYYHVNTVLRNLYSKASREDIKQVDYLHVDIDAKAGADLESEIKRIYSLLTDKRPQGIPEPTYIIFSGGGYQAFWELKEPIPINGNIKLAEETKLYNKYIEKVFNADNCHNVDRLMRLPGTLNIPDAKKIKRGRLPRVASLVHFNENNVYGLEQFSKATENKSSEEKISISSDLEIHILNSIDDLNKWNIDDRIKVIIVQGHDPDNPKENDSSRSAWLFDVVCNLVRGNVPDNVVYSIITDKRYAISESVLENKNHEKYAIRQIQRAKEKILIDTQSFIVDRGGKIVKNQENVLIALRKLGIKLSYDKFSNRQLIEGLEGFGNYLDDAAVARIYLKIEKEFGFKLDKNFFWMIIEDQARANSFHPVEDYFQTLNWDGVNRTDNWLVKYAGAEDTELNRKIGQILLVAAVRRIKRPGCKFDEMVILESKQGQLKSTALRILAVNPEWFSDDLPFNMDTKRLMESMAGHWIIEAGELQGLRKADTESLKSFLSRSVDKSRLAYARLTTEMPRQCIIVGTTNSDKYLTDNTGNRRFWPVKVGKFDIEMLKQDRDQLWAEAVHLEAQGYSIRLDPSLYSMAAEEQAARRIEDPYLQILSDKLGDRTGKIRTQNIWDILEIPISHRNYEHNKRIGDIMRELGWTREKKRFGGKPEWAYVKGNKEEQNQELRDPEVF